MIRAAAIPTIPNKNESSFTELLEPLVDVDVVPVVVPVVVPISEPEE
jgi:hypothetical protein